jgi:hypothetical protein
MSQQEPSQDFSNPPAPERAARKRPVSERKIQANRRNALRSTGPTTARGKRNVSCNAIKHGLLARQVVITAGDGEESLTEFQDLVEKLREQYKPVGVIEELLVQIIATCWWRKARVIRAETGEIRKRLDTAALDRTQRNSDEANLALGLSAVGFGLFRKENQADQKMSSSERRSALHVVRKNLRGHHLGLTYLSVLVEKAKSDIASSGHISKLTAEKIFHSFCSWDFLFAFACLNADPPEGKIEDRQSGEAGDKQADKQRAIIAAVVDDQLERINELKEQATEGEALAVDAEARSFSLPPADATDKLLRYEAHLDRQLYRAMGQLERLQRQRRGETVPPPLNINLGRGR